MNMFNKEKFHNHLALTLGYERIIKNKGIVLKIDYTSSNTPKVIIEFSCDNLTIVYNASDDPKKVLKEQISPEQWEKIEVLKMKHEVTYIVDAIYQSYFESMNDRFPVFSVQY